VTLTQRGLLIEEARTHLMLQSSDLSHTSWIKSKVALKTATNFPIFAEMPVLCVTKNGGAGEKYNYRTFFASSTTKTFSAFLLAGTGIFAQIIGGADDNSYANFNI
jgi:hypothetical protein